MANTISGPVNTGGDGIHIEIRPPLSFILRQVGQFRHELEDLDHLWDRFAEVLPEIFAAWFESHGDGAWPPLAESTLAEKSKAGFPADPLVRTGALKNSLIDPNTAVERSSSQMAWGTNAPYAGYHQLGTSRMPMRQVIPDPFPAADRQKLEATVVAWVNDAAARMSRSARAA